MAVLMDAGGGITIIDCVKDFLYSKFIYTGGNQELLRWISCFMVISKASHISDVFFGVIGYRKGRYPYKGPFSPMVRIE